MKREDRAQALEDLFIELQEIYIPKISRLIIADYIEAEINKATQEGYNNGWNDAIGVDK